ncbi:DUF3108 domain-containing protein [candidate division KSB1 bacterium]|nr:DUF3108 domain-containing protein [candidate division KSB1 bacterium]
MKKPIIALIILIAWSRISAASDFTWQIGEELNYQVSWLSIPIATLKISIKDSLRMDNCLVYHTQFRIKTNPHLFFIKFYGIYDSYIDDSFRPHLFVGYEPKDGFIDRTRYRFDYENGVIHSSLTNKADTLQIIEKVVPIQEHILDGTALIYYLRAHLPLMRDENLVAFLSGQKKSVRIYRKSDETRTMKIAGIEKNVQEIQGKVNFVSSVAGITGNFCIFFENSAQAIPLKAKLKIFLGYVNITFEAKDGRNLNYEEYVQNR